MTRASKNTRAPSLRKCWLSSTAKGIQRKGQRKVPAMVSPPTASVQIVWLSSPCRFQPVPKAPNSAPRHRPERCRSSACLWLRARQKSRPRSAIPSCHCEARGKGGEKKDWMRFLWYPPAGLFLFSYSFSTLLLLQGWIHNNRIHLNRFLEQCFRMLPPAPTPLSFSVSLPLSLQTKTKG